MPAPKRGPKRKTVEASREASPAPSGWKRPAHLTGEAARGWDHIYCILRSSGNLGRTDPTLVECYAINFALLREARAIMAKEGIFTKNSAGCTVSHPGIGIVNSATMRLKAIVNDLGLCPSSSKHSASSVAIGAGPGDKDATAEEREWEETLAFTG